MQRDWDTGRAAELNRESVDTSDQLAGWWDDLQGDEGNRTHKRLVAPALERLLALQQGELALDIACGNGIFSRRMAELGAQVVAFDASQAFIERARARTDRNADRIEYRVIDATDVEAMASLGEQRFDAAVSSMALMDLPTLEPLAHALGRVMKARGRFVFAVLHPCFNSCYSTMVIEQELQDGNIVPAQSVKVSEYMTPAYGRGTAAPGQPVGSYWFHRPISMLLSPFFQAGFVLDAIEEPVSGPDDSSDRPFSWANYKGIPSVLVARLRWLEHG